MKTRTHAILAAIAALATVAGLRAQPAAQYSFSTLAGVTGLNGLSNGTNASAVFNAPSAVAVDSNGNVYVADTNNYVVREISAGTTFTLAGTGGPGHTDGAAASAVFGPLKGIAVDSKGNVYVSDWGTNSASGYVREISTAGQVSTLASGLNAPLGLTVGSDGSIYVAESGNYVVRKLAANTYAVSTYAGTVGKSGNVSGGVGTGEFGFPTGVALDSSGNLYVVDSIYSIICKVSTSGAISTLAGQAANPGTANGNGTNAQFDHPYGIAIDGNNNLYVTDTETDLIRAIDTSANVTTIAGTAGQTGSLNGTGANAWFSDPTGIAANAAGDIWVADTNNSLIRAGAPVTSNAPQIQYQPSGETVPSGGTATLQVTASGTNLSYQWYFNGTAISGATSSVLTISNISSSQAGTYYVVVSNSSGSITSNSVQVAVGSSSSGAPIITTQPASQAVNTGGTLTLSVAASGSGLSYQWYENGTALSNGGSVSGATSSTLTIAPIAATQAGSYTVTVTNSSGNATSSAAAVTVQTSAKLVNLSALGIVAGSGASDLTAGFSIGGGSKTVLLRGVGPDLASKGLSGQLNTPMLTLSQSGTTLQTNEGWSANGQGPSITAAEQNTGAFLLPSGSADTALLPTLNAGQYTEEVDGINGSTGLALVEIYDDDASTSVSRLVNISARATVTGSNALIGGFSIGGASSETVLIRGIGPYLGTIGLTGVLANPVLTIYDHTGAVVASNTGWSNAPVVNSSVATSDSAAFQAATNAEFSNVGAFQLTSGSADCALVAVLPPGQYTAQVTGANGSSGIALVEVYETR